MFYLNAICAWDLWNGWPPKQCGGDSTQEQVTSTWSKSLSDCWRGNPKVSLMNVAGIMSKVVQIPKPILHRCTLRIRLISYYNKPCITRVLLRIYSLYRIVSCSMSYRWDICTDSCNNILMGKQNWRPDFTLIMNFINFSHRRVSSALLIEKLLSSNSWVHSTQGWLMIFWVTKHLDSIHHITIQLRFFCYM